MIKKQYFFIGLIILITALVAFFYLADSFNLFRSQLEEKTFYTAKDFPLALQKMDEKALKITLDDLNKQYQKKAEGDYVYIRWVNIGILKKRLGDLKGAEEAWLKAIDYESGKPLAYGNVADLYLFDLQEYQKAEEYYQKAILLNPVHYEYYLGLVSLYRYNLTEKKNLIEKIMLDGVRADPSEAENFYMYLANYFYEGPEENGGNDLEKAKYYTQKTLEINPNLKDQLPDL